MTGITTKRITTALASGLLAAVLPFAVHAAPTPRWGHSTTMLTTGDVMFVGGVTAAGTVTGTSDIFAASRDNVVIAGATLATARSSHTATLMSNGCVIVAGGNTSNPGAAATPTSTIEFYNPATGLFSNPFGISLGTPRYNHTATLLNDGRVLFCGGADAAGNAISTCDIYTPTSCTNGSVSPGASLQKGRYNHTATLLADGKVWFAGGSTTNAAGFAQTPTTERFDPGAGGAGTMSSASPLIESRALHTATLMGDGKVLVAGGYNGRNVLANQGILLSAEIYDPVGNTITPAGPMAARRMQTASVLQADGTVVNFGGLGNITTTYFNATGVLKPGSFTLGTLSALTTTQLTGGTLKLDLDQLLGQQVQGVIMDGEVWMSSPAIHWSGGQTNFYPADPVNSAVGLRMPLNGETVGCRMPAGTPCGLLLDTDVPMSNIQGQTVFYPMVNQTPSNTPTVNGGALRFAGPISNVSVALTNTTTLSTTLSILFPKELIGGNVLAGSQATIISGQFTQTSSFSVTMTGGVANIPTTAIVFDPISSKGVATFPVTFTGVTGTLDASAADGGSAYSMSSPYFLPVTAGVPINLTLTITYVADRVDVYNQQFTVDASTIVIRKMVFADREHYNPKTNVWSFTAPGGASAAISPATDQRFGASAALLPTNDVVVYGGRACSGATCATSPANPSIGYQLLSSENNFAPGNGPMAGPRAFHTSTLLPDKTILVAGGTNGPSVIRTAEIFDPATERFSPTNSPLNEYRDLHTATLLPNGRVLLAGGFTTNAVSTGSTNSVEVYYPDTKTFLYDAPMISSRSNHSAVMLPDGRVFVAGGFGPGDVVTGTAEIYISTEHRWVPAATMPVGCERAISAAVQIKDGRVLLFGGVNAGGILNSVAAYTPASNTWSCVSVTGMPTPLRSHTATLLFDGRVLIAGGNDGFGEANVSYTWSPLSNAWTQTAGFSFLEPRFNHTATLLPNGAVMISGGSQTFGNVPTSIEVFHVNGSSWVTGGFAAGMKFSAGPRAFHTMTLAANNKVYGLGGSDGVVGGIGTNFWAPAEGGYFTSTPDSRSKGAPPSTRQSTITVTSAYPFLFNTPLTVQGNRFRGGTEASGGGAASANSAFSFPHMVLQQIDGSGGAASQSNGGFAVDLTTQIYLNSSNFATLNTSVTVALPATNAELPYGWYTLRMGSNGVYSDATIVQAGPAKPTVAPTGMAGVALGVSSISWTWNSIPGVDGYNVYLATTNVFVATVPATGSPTFIHRNLEASATDSIIVAGYTLSGDGPLTNGPTSYTLSTTPVNVAIASVTFSDLLLYWGTNGNAAPGTVYEVSESSDNFLTSFSTPVPTLFNLTTTFTVISGLSQNSTYYFRVRAFNPVGSASPFSAVVSTITRAGVGQPLVNTETTTSIQWKWPTVNGVTNFRVYNATNNVLLATVPGGTFIYDDVGLSTNAIRSIQVSAVTGAGEGPLSPSASAYTLAAPPQMTSPDIPSVFLTSGSFRVTWLPNGNPLTTPYTMLFAEYDSNGVVVSTFGTVTNGFVANALNLKPGVLYSYSLTAANGDGVKSTPVVFGSTWTIPTDPTPITITGTTPSTISIDWSPNGNSSSTTYQVRYTTDNFVTSFSTPITFGMMFNATAYTLTGLATSTSYTIEVVGRNPFGQQGPFVQITTSTFNGGGAQGSISGMFAEASDSQIQGTLGGGRFVDFRAPAHTFSQNVTMVISSQNVTGLCPNGVNIGFNITDTPAIQPNGSLYLTFSYTNPELGAIPVNRALLMRYEPVSGACVPLETVVDPATNRMTARINHFSVFQVAQIPLQTNTDFARVFPNPFRASRDGYVTIDQVPPGARVRIFTLRGEQVMDQYANASGLLTWSGTNGFGRSVASGVYIVLIESGANRKTLKMSLIR